MAERRLGYVALVVRDYDEAIAYYTSVLDFVLIEDTRLTDTKRWVLVAPSGASETRLLLARAVGAEQESRIGAQTGGRVFLFKILKPGEDPLFQALGHRGRGQGLEKGAVVFGGGHGFAAAVAKGQMRADPAHLAFGERAVQEIHELVVDMR